jgi:hypothetical protein
LHLRAIQNQALKHLTLKLCIVWEADGLLTQLALRHASTQAQFPRGDGFAVHNGDDSINGLRLGRQGSVEYDRKKGTACGQKK